MIGLPNMFWPFYAHQRPAEVFKDACRHFQCLSVLWTCEFEQQKKVLQPTLGSQKSSLPDDWASQDVLAILCFLGPPEFFKDACGHFQCLPVLSTCQVEQQKKVLQPTLGRQKSSLLHDSASQDVLAILCFLRPPKVFKVACGHFQCLSVLRPDRKSVV